MPFEVRLPDIGEGVAEGEIVRWLIKPGDAVREDQPLVEVMTDKANVEIPSPRTGTIEALHAEEGQVIPVGALMVTIAVSGAGTSPGAATAAEAGRTGSGAAGGAAGSPSARGSVAGAPAPAHPSTGPAGPAPPSAPSSTGVQAAPAVRQLARELGVALEGLVASGPGGRVTADDVRAAAAGTRKGPAGPKVAAPGPEERVPLRGLRRRIAENMRRSLNTAAHFTFVAECDMSAVSEHLRSTRGRAQKLGVPLTYLAYVVKALVEPLRRFPLLNASLDDASHEVVLKRYYHVGIATATSEGLTVPVVHDVDRLTLIAVGSEIRRLAEAARAGTLKLDELQGGTFTVTSTGARGGLLATPIVHHPQVAILGVHEVKKRPVVVDDAIVIREMTNLSLSLDHRVVDGAVGAEFLYAVIARLSDPAAWLNPEEIG